MYLKSRGVVVILNTFAIAVECRQKSPVTNTLSIATDKT
jgi:hypothetical protein